MDYTLSDEDEEAYREAFDLFDKDRSGAISKNELRTVMQNLGMNPSDKDLMDMIDEHDTDKSGQIEFEEFCKMMCRAKQEDESGDNTENLKAAFRTFDKDGSGFISADELRQVMTQLGQCLGDDEVDAMIQEADEDGDGQINYEEFVRMMHPDKR